MEVYEVEHVAHVDVLQFHKDGIIGTGRCPTVGDEMLIAVANLEMVDVDVVFTVDNMGWLHFPKRVAHSDIRGQEAEPGSRDAIGFAEEFSRCVHRAVDGVVGVGSAEPE